MGESNSTVTKTFEEIFEEFVANPPTPDTDQGNTFVSWRLHNVILERGARVVPVFHTFQLQACGQYYFGKSNMTLEGSEYTLVALIDRHSGNSHCGFVGDVRPYFGEGRFFSRTTNTNRRASGMTLNLREYPQSVAYGSAPVVLGAPPNLIKASLAAATDPHLDSPRDTFKSILGNIQSRFREAIGAFTAEARKNNAPHQYRPELRGSGVPRKRGKGRA